MSSFDRFKTDPTGTGRYSINQDLSGDRVSVEEYSNADILRARRARTRAEPSPQQRPPVPVDDSAARRLPDRRSDERWTTDRMVEEDPAGGFVGSFGTAWSMFKDVVVPKGNLGVAAMYGELDDEGSNQLAEVSNKEAEYQGMMAARLYAGSTRGRRTLMEYLGENLGGLAASMYYSATDSPGTTLGVTAAGAAAGAAGAAAGLVSPVPGGMVAGAKIAFGVGVAAQMGRMVAGNAYLEMVHDGIDPKIARNYAYLVGGGEATIEMAQYGTLIGGSVIRKAGKRWLKGYVKDRAAKLAAKSAAEGAAAATATGLRELRKKALLSAGKEAAYSIAENVAEEMGQTMNEEFWKRQAAIEYNKTLPPHQQLPIKDMVDILRDVKDTGYEVFGAMAVLGGASGSFHGWRSDVKLRRKLEEAEARQKERVKGRLRGVNTSGEAAKKAAQAPVKQTLTIEDRDGNVVEVVDVTTANEVPDPSSGTATAEASTPPPPEAQPTADGNGGAETGTGSAPPTDSIESDADAAAVAATAAARKELETLRSLADALEESLAADGKDAVDEYKESRLAGFRDEQLPADMRDIGKRLDRLKQVQDQIADLISAIDEVESAGVAAEAAATEGVQAPDLRSVRPDAEVEAQAEIDRKVEVEKAAEKVTKAVKKKKATKKKTTKKKAAKKKATKKAQEKKTEAPITPAEGMEYLFSKIMEGREQDDEEMSSGEAVEFKNFVDEQLSEQGLDNRDDNINVVEDDDLSFSGTDVSVDASSTKLESDGSRPAVITGALSNLSKLDPATTVTIVVRRKGTDGFEPVAIKVDAADAEAVQKDKTKIFDVLRKHFQAGRVVGRIFTGEMLGMQDFLQNYTMLRVFEGFERQALSNALQGLSEAYASERTAYYFRDFAAKNQQERAKAVRAAASRYAKLRHAVVEQARKALDMARIPLDLVEVWSVKRVGNEVKYGPDGRPLRDRVIKLREDATEEELANPLASVVFEAEAIPDSLAIERDELFHEVHSIEQRLMGDAVRVRAKIARFSERAAMLFSSSNIDDVVAGVEEASKAVEKFGVENGKRSKEASDNVLAAKNLLAEFVNGVKRRREALEKAAVITDKMHDLLEEARKNADADKEKVRALLDREGVQQAILSAVTKLADLRRQYDLEIKGPDQVELAERRLSNLEREDYRLGEEATQKLAFIGRGDPGANLIPLLAARLLGFVTGGQTWAERRKHRRRSGAERELTISNARRGSEADIRRLGLKNRVFVQGKSQGNVGKRALVENVRQSDVVVVVGFGAETTEERLARDAARKYKKRVISVNLMELTDEQAAAVLVEQLAPSAKMQAGGKPMVVNVVGSNFTNAGQRLMIPNGVGGLADQQSALDARTNRVFSMALSHMARAKGAKSVFSIEGYFNNERGGGVDYGPTGHGVTARMRSVDLRPEELSAIDEREAKSISFLQKLIDRINEGHDLRYRRSWEKKNPGKKFPGIPKAITASRLSIGNFFVGSVGGGMKAPSWAVEEGNIGIRRDVLADEQATRADYEAFMAAEAAGGDQAGARAVVEAVFREPNRREAATEHVRAILGGTEAERQSRAYTVRRYISAVLRGLGGKSKQHPHRFALDRVLVNQNTGELTVVGVSTKAESRQIQKAFAAKPPPHMNMAVREISDEEDQVRFTFDDSSFTNDTEHMDYYIRALVQVEALNWQAPVSIQGEDGAVVYEGILGQNLPPGDKESGFLGFMIEMKRSLRESYDAYQRREMSQARREEERRSKLGRLAQLGVLGKALANVFAKKDVMWDPDSTLRANATDGKAPGYINVVLEGVSYAQLRKLMALRYGISDTAPGVRADYVLDDIILGNRRPGVDMPVTGTMESGVGALELETTISAGGFATYTSPVASFLTSERTQEEQEKLTRERRLANFSIRGYTEQDLRNLYGDENSWGADSIVVFQNPSERYQGDRSQVPREVAKRFEAQAAVVTTEDGAMEPVWVDLSGVTGRVVRQLGPKTVEVEIGNFTDSSKQARNESGELLYESASGQPTTDKLGKDGTPNQPIMRTVSGGKYRARTYTREIVKHEVPGNWKGAPRESVMVRESVFESTKPIKIVVDTSLFEAGKSRIKRPSVMPGGLNSEGVITLSVNKSIYQYGEGQGGVRPGAVNKEAEATGQFVPTLKTQFQVRELYGDDMNAVANASGRETRVNRKSKERERVFRPLEGIRDGIITAIIKAGSAEEHGRFSSVRSALDIGQDATMVVTGNVRKGRATPKGSIGIKINKAQRVPVAWVLENMDAFAEAMSAETGMSKGKIERLFGYVRTTSGGYLVDANAKYGKQAFVYIYGFEPVVRKQKTKVIEEVDGKRVERTIEKDVETYVDVQNRRRQMRIDVQKNYASYVANALGEVLGSDTAQEAEEQSAIDTSRHGEIVARASAALQKMLGESVLLEAWKGGIRVHIGRNVSLRKGATDPVSVAMQRMEDIDNRVTTVKGWSQSSPFTTFQVNRTGYGTEFADAVENMRRFLEDLQGALDRNAARAEKQTTKAITYTGFMRAKAARANLILRTMLDGRPVHLSFRSENIAEEKREDVAAFVREVSQAVNEAAENGVVEEANSEAQGVQVALDEPLIADTATQGSIGIEISTDNGNPTVTIYEYDGEKYNKLAEQAAYDTAAPTGQEAGTAEPTRPEARTYVAPSTSPDAIESILRGVETLISYGRKNLTFGWRDANSKRSVAGLFGRWIGVGQSALTRATGTFIRDDILDLIYRPKSKMAMSGDSFTTTLRKSPVVHVGVDKNKDATGGVFDDRGDEQKIANGRPVEPMMFDDATVGVVEAEMARIERELTNNPKLQDARVQWTGRVEFETAAGVATETAVVYAPDDGSMRPVVITVQGYAFVRDILTTIGGTVHVVEMDNGALAVAVRDFEGRLAGLISGVDAIESRVGASSSTSELTPSSYLALLRPGLEDAMRANENRSYVRGNVTEAGAAKRKAAADTMLGDMIGWRKEITVKDQEDVSESSIRTRAEKGFEAEPYDEVKHLTELIGQEAAREQWEGNLGPSGQPITTYKGYENGFPGVANDGITPRDARWRRRELGRVVRRIGRLFGLPRIRSGTVGATLKHEMGADGRLRTIAVSEVFGAYNHSWRQLQLATVLDIKTALHEIGHHVHDMVLGAVNSTALQISGEGMLELLQMTSTLNNQWAATARKAAKLQDRINEGKGLTNDERKVLNQAIREGFAQYFHLYVILPGEAAKVAPVYTEFFENFLSATSRSRPRLMKASLADAIRQARTEVSQVASLDASGRIAQVLRDITSDMVERLDRVTPSERIKGRISDTRERLVSMHEDTEGDRMLYDTPADEKSKLDKFKGYPQYMWRKFKILMEDDTAALQWMQKLMGKAVGGKMAPRNRIWWWWAISRGAVDWAKVAQTVRLSSGPLAENPKVYFDKGFQNILDPIYSGGHTRDFNLFAFAQHVVKDGKRLIEKSSGLVPPGNYSYCLTFLEELREKDPEKFALFSEVEDEVQAFWRAMHEMMVDEGMIGSLDAYRIAEMHWFYVPVRELDENANWDQLPTASVTKEGGLYTRDSSSPREGMFDPISAWSTNLNAVIMAVAKHRAKAKLVEQVNIHSKDMGDWMHRRTSEELRKQAQAKMQGYVVGLTRKLHERNINDVTDKEIEVFAGLLAELGNSQMSEDDRSIMRVREVREVRGSWVPVNGTSRPPTVAHFVEYNIHEDLAVFVNPEKSNPSQFWRIVTGPASTLRKYATIASSFIMRNVIRDQFTALLQSKKNGARPFYDMARGLMDVVGQSDMYVEAMESGIGQSSMLSAEMLAEATVERERRYHNYIRNLEKKLKRKPTDREIMAAGLKYAGGRMISGQFFDTLMDISQALETATRMGEYRRIRELHNMGYSLFGHESKETSVSEEERMDAIVEAAWFARNTTIDFRRGGTVGRKINMGVPFFSAGIHGPVRMAEVMYEAMDKADERDMNKLIAMIAGIQMVSIAVWALGRDDEEWQELPGWEHEMAWNIPVRKLGLEFLENIGIHYLSLPKPHLGASFGPISVDSMLRYWDNADKESADQFAADMLSAFGGESTRRLSSFWLPAIARPVIEAMYNKSFFKAAPLWPVSRDYASMSQKFTPGTSDVSKLTSIALEQLPFFPDNNLTAPASLDNFVYAWFGGTGRTALSAVDMAISAVSHGYEVLTGERLPGLDREGWPPEKPWTKFPFIGEAIDAVTIGDPRGASKSMIRYYDYYAEGVVRHREFKNATTAAQRRTLVRRNPQYFKPDGRPTAVYLRVRAIKGRMDKLSEAQKAVMRYPESAFPEGAKRAFLDYINVTKMSLAAWAFNQEPKGEDRLHQLRSRYLNRTREEFKNAG